jgi:hypothetical protein
MKHLKLFESFKSQKELETFTTAMLESYSDEIVKTIESKFFKMTYDKMPIIELSMFNPNIYSELKDFIKENPELQFHIVGKKDFINYKSGEYAHYVTDNKGNQLIQVLGDSIFTDGDSIVDTINKSINQWNGDWDKEDYGYSDERYESSYYKMISDIGRSIKKYESSLLHELQHAYDNWRSKGKYNTDSVEFIDNEKKTRELKNRLYLEESEQEFINKHYQDYLNLRYEVDARFTQAIKKLDFYDVDWDLTQDYSDNDFLYSMIPFSKVFKDFKRVYKEYKSLNPKEKKRVDKKLGQFYQLEKDFILDSNIKEIINNKSNTKSYEQLKKELLK